jgi:acyl dehydratase
METLALRSRKTPRWTSSHLVRWCAAQQNWDKIHYDSIYAKSYASLPERVVNGALKQHLISSYATGCFDDRATLRRVKYRFLSPDFVGEQIEAIGKVIKRFDHEGGDFVELHIDLRNVQRDDVTTTASALLQFDADAIPCKLPAEWNLKKEIDCNARGNLPPDICRLIGQQIDDVTSFCPLDLGRLCLFADAVGWIHPKHFDASIADQGPHKGIVAPPLFPIHGLTPPPGSKLLSESPSALGREAVAEVGRDLSALFEIPDGGALNGGNDVEIFSPLRLGETLRATSTLADVSVKDGKKGGKMMIALVENHYETTSGRRVLNEMQTVIYRL